MRTSLTCLLFLVLCVFDVGVTALKKEEEDAAITVAMNETIEGSSECSNDGGNVVGSSTMSSAGRTEQRHRSKHMGQYEVQREGKGGKGKGKGKGDDDRVDKDEGNDSDHAFDYHQLNASMSSQDRECSGLLKRFHEEMGTGVSEKEDKIFPSAMTSIARSGNTFIDTDHRKFNQWKSIKLFAGGSAKRDAGKISVLGNKIGSTDVEQGQVGNCFFLSVLASMAHKNERIIRGMFVDTKFKNGVIRTKWQANGKETVVAVNPDIPGDQKPFFVRASPSGTWWPVILEKSFAKIWGSYQALDTGGRWLIAASAVTGAPTVVYKYDETHDKELWKRLLEVFRKGYPAGSLIHPNKGEAIKKAGIGLTPGHAYSVLDAWEDKKTGQKIVQVRDPTHRHNYNGELKNHPKQTDGKEHGAFILSYEEFTTFYFALAVNLVQYNHDVDAYHKVTSKPFSLGKLDGQIEKELTFSTKKDASFAVSLVWPNARMFGGKDAIAKHCGAIKPSFNLDVRKSGSRHWRKHEFAPWTNRAFVQIPETDGPGKYEVRFSIKFPGTKFIQAVHLNVYAHPSESIVFEETKLAG